jgi:type IV pilus assembly protein PilY1
LLTQDQLNYIRGDQSQEKPAGKLRTRLGLNGLMGDIVNSDPYFINSISQGYDSLPGAEGQDYLKYITSPALISRTPMLAVGANDGMLHVFDASFDKTNSGKEILSYVPNTIIGNLPALTLPTYVGDGGHKYFVDGSPISGDAYFDADGDSDKEWRTALVGTLGAGGKGLFALDLTFLDPANYKTAESAFLAKRVLWEINDQAAPDNLADDFSSSPKRYGFTNYLGFTLGQASIARMANDNFAAVFGNGYNSVSQTAVLYIVDIKTGHLIRSITTEVGDSGAVNGLASPLVVDANGDHITDAVYAGDYQGNMWKFDVSDKNPDNWKVAFTSSSRPAPLFTTLSSPYTAYDSFAKANFTTAEVSQPITIKPVFGRHPNGGVMLYFGTGKYFLRSDNDVDIQADPVQTFYGIWDECVNYAGVTANCSNVPISGKAALVKQSIDYENADARVTSNNEVNYSTQVDENDPPPKKGWYMDFYYEGGTQIFTGERVISQAILRGRRIIFPTTTPELAGCNFGGSSWLMVLDALTGKRLDVSAFGVLSGGEFVADKIILPGDEEDEEIEYSVSGIKSTVGMIDTPAILETDGATENLVGSGSSGDTEQYSISRPAGSRQSWVQIR